jgi:hypothetical protein
VAVLGQWAVAVKANDGLMEPAAVATIEILRRRKMLTRTAEAALEEHARPVVLGGGYPVGEWEPGLT